MELYRIDDFVNDRYYQIPTELFTGEKYKDSLDNNARTLYAILLNRMKLSIVNGWITDDKAVFLIYTRQDIADMMKVCVNTAVKTFKQLRNAGLIHEKRQGQGKPNLIFVCKVEYDTEKVDAPDTVGDGSQSEQTSNNCDFRIPNCSFQESQKMVASKKENIKHENLRTKAKEKIKAIDSS